MLTAGLGNAASAAIDVSVNCDLLVDAFAKLAAASAEHCSSAVLGAATLSAKRQPLQEGRDKANASHEAFQHELQGMRDRQSGLAAAVALEAAPAPVDERARKVLEAEVEAIAIARAALKDEKDRVSTLRANHCESRALNPNVLAMLSPSSLPFPRSSCSQGDRQAGGVQARAGREGYRRPKGAAGRDDGCAPGGGGGHRSRKHCREGAGRGRQH